MRRSSFLPLALLLVATPLRAAEARISVNDVARQRAPVALLEPDGTARVIWENSKLGIMSRVVPADDPASATTEEKILVSNTHLSSVPGEGIVITHRQPVAVSDGSGGFWLVWVREKAYVKAAPFWESRDVLSQEIRRWQFDRNGKPVGSDGVVAWARGANRAQTAAIGTADGGFVVAWSSSDGDTTPGPRDGVFARWFDSDGKAFGTSVRVSAIEDGDLATWPSLTIDARGRLLVLWQAPDGSSTGIFGRMFDEKRAPLDATQRLNLNLVGTEKRPSAVALDDGGFLVFWQGPRGSGASTRVFLRQLDAEGNPIGAERAISSASFFHEMGPAVAPTPRGTYFVAWVAWDSMFPREIRGVELRSDGTIVGDEQKLSTFGINAQYRATVVAGQGTGLFTVWEGFPDRRAAISGTRLDFLD